MYSTVLRHTALCRQKPTRWYSNSKCSTHVKYGRRTEYTVCNSIVIIISSATLRQICRSSGDKKKVAVTRTSRLPSSLFPPWKSNQHTSLITYVASLVDKSTMVGFDLLPLAAALLVAAAPLSSVAVHGGGAPICDSKEGACSGRTQKNVRKQATSSVASVEEDDNDDYDYESYDDDEEKEKEGCDIFLAESAVQPGKLGIFTGIRRSEGEVVGEPEVIIPILDARKNEWSPWNDMVLPADTFPQLLQESRYLNDAFVPGIGAIAACSRRFSNLAPSPGEAAAVDAAGVHRSASPAAGSFSYYHNFTFEAARDMLPGEEMVLPCPDDYDEEDYDDYYYYYRQRDGGRKVLNVDILKDSSFCLDNLTVKKSTIEGAGRGAFAKRPVGAGQVIAHSPVLHFDRSQMEIVDQQVYPEDHWLETRRSHNIMYSETKVGQQLMLNYCYGQPASNLQPASNVLLLPYAPMVNYINANAERGKANAFVRWPSEKTKAVLPGVDAPHMKSQRPMELFAVPARGPDSHENLMIEFVAMRDILVRECPLARKLIDSTSVCIAVPNVSFLVNFHTNTAR